MAPDQLALTRSTRSTVPNPNRAVRQHVPAFLNKLYSMVNDPDTDELIYWSQEGDSFFVPNHERFSREMLPRFFKHTNFSSFVRQLNMYGFHKVPHLQQGVLQNETETELWQFVSPHFQRGQPDLLCLIQRKKANAIAGENNDEDGNIVTTTSTTNTAQPSGSTGGAQLDVSTIAGGLAAIKRHQATISSELKDLQQSNTALWQEALAARERHKKHQDTINRILKFLAGVFGTNAGAPSNPRSREDTGSSSGSQLVPRKRPRLMIEDSDDKVGESHKAKPKKPEPVHMEEADDDDWADEDVMVPMDIDHHNIGSGRIAELNSPMESTSQWQTGKIESVVSTPATATFDIKSPEGGTLDKNPFSRAGSSLAVPTVSGRPSSQGNSTPSSSKTSPNLANAAVSVPSPSYAYPQTLTSNPYLFSNQPTDPSLSSITQPTPNSIAPSNILNTSDQAAFQALLNSPASLQRVLNALSVQPSGPSGLPPLTGLPSNFGGENQYPQRPVGANGSGGGGLPYSINDNGQQLIPSGGSYGMTNSLNPFPSGSDLGFDPTDGGAEGRLTPNSMLALLNGGQQQQQSMGANGGYLMNGGGVDDNGALSQSLNSHTNNLQRAYESADQIHADVDAIQHSINSLIESMGLDPSMLANLQDGIPNFPDSVNNGANGTEHGSSAVDFDALLSQFGNANGDAHQGGDAMDGTALPFDMAQDDPRLTALNAQNFPFTSLDDTMGDTQNPGAFLDEVLTTSTASSPVQSLADEFTDNAGSLFGEAGKGKIKKRKSDVINHEEMKKPAGAITGGKKPKSQRRK